MKLLKVLKNINSHPLNRKCKIKSIIRYLKWQIGSRILKGDFIFEWIDGSRLIVKNGEKGVTGNIYCGLQDFQDMAFLYHLLSKDDLFIDIGANAGTYTILACAVKKAKGYAFEPIPSTLFKIKK